MLVQTSIRDPNTQAEIPLTLYSEGYIRFTSCFPQPVNPHLKPPNNSLYQLAIRKWYSTFKIQNPDTK